MNNILAIAKKELNYYFGSPIGWVVIGLFTTLFGLFFLPGLSFFLQQSLSVMSMGAGAPPMNVNQHLIGPSIGNMAVTLLLVLPIVTMRTFSEEKRSGTIELLLTSPVTDVEIIFGKFIAAMGLYAAMLAATLIPIVALYAFGTPEWKPLLTTYLGIFLFGGCFISLGLFISSRTKNQIIAAMWTFATFLMLWIINWGASFMGPMSQAMVNYLALVDHLEDFTRGIIDTEHLIYYLSFIAFGLFLTVRSMDSERWRG